MVPELGRSLYQRWDLDSGWSAQGSRDFFYGAGLLKCSMKTFKIKYVKLFIYCLLPILYLIMRSFSVYTREKIEIIFIKL